MMWPHSRNSKDVLLFDTTHNTSDAERMVHRVREGVAVTRYRQLDYEKIQQTIAEKKSSGQVALAKLKKIEATARHRKEESSNKNHLQVWNREMLKLGSIRRQLEAELEAMKKENSVLYRELISYNSALDEDFEEFRKNTTDSIWQLREDLRVWIQLQRGQVPDECLEAEDPDSVLETVSSIKDQQRKILNMLAAEQEQLESELNIETLRDPLLSTDIKYVQTGIPEEAFDLPCPDLQLKVAVLQEFILLDGKYVEKLNELERNYSETLRVANGGWSKYDHELFTFVVDMYTRESTEGGRQLYISCLQRCLQHLSRNEIVEHEDWWTRYKLYHQRHRDMINGWSRDRAEFLNRIKNVFNEACVAKQLQDARIENRQKQREFCDTLYAKVRDWHEQKMEAFRLEQELAEAERARADLNRVASEEKERARRQQQKDKIRQFHQDLEAKQKQKEEKDRKRLEELHRFLEEQAAVDRGRVKFREEEYLKKQEEKKLKLEEQQAAAEEKERILEDIRSKVRPDVQGDLLRLWSETIAWQARHKPEEHIDIQKPLFDMNTFTSERILADPRVRADQRLREAGLQNSEYARQALRQIQPLRPPRRDMASTIFQ